jgi:thiosulfate dehydrogenase [quinone] large subunit
MFIKFLQKNSYASYVLTVFRLYIGWNWVNAGWGKISGGTFDAAGFLKDALNKASGDNPTVPAWWADFLHSFALPSAGLFNLLIPWGEFFVGLGLVLGIFTTIAALMGMIMNFSYMFSGATNPNPQMILLEIFILIAGFNAAKIGIDHWLVPFVKKQILEKILKKEEEADHTQSA